MCRVSALAERAGIPASELASLSDDDGVFDILAFYVGQLCVVLCLTLCPQRIVIGGGPVSARAASLLPKIRKEFQAQLAVRRCLLVLSVLFCPPLSFVRSSHWSHALISHGVVFCQVEVARAKRCGRIV